ncbi:MAG TPA: DUF881 domain-containing protein [Clostridia bacterium]|nr:DUF881 domain-containing protein [Clostridia bacterium]
MVKNRGWYISLTLVSLVLGFLLSTQFQTQQKVLTALDAQRKEDLIAVWKNLDDKNRLLQEEIENLDAAYRDLLAQSERETSALKTMMDDINRLRLISGMTPVTGPGITVTITGDAPLYFLDLVDLINELWATGAEAISVNDHRITSRTSIAEASDAFSFYITVDGQRLLFPVIVKAIGDPHTLEKGLTFTGGLIDIWKTQYGIHPEVQQRQEINIPAVKSVQPWFYARVVTPQ